MSQREATLDDTQTSADPRRITLVTAGKDLPERGWEYSREGSSRPVFVDTLSVLRWAVSSRVGLSYLDLERVIIDRAASPADYLDILSSLAPDFCGDVLYVGDGDSGYLSARGRGGDRVLYAMSAEDVRFYLETHGTSRERTAAERRQRLRIVTAA